MCAANPALAPQNSNAISGGGGLKDLADQLRQGEQDAQRRNEHELRMRLLQEELKARQLENENQRLDQQRLLKQSPSESNAAANPCLIPLREYLLARQEGRDPRTLPCAPKSSP